MKGTVREPLLPVCLFVCLFVASTLDGWRTSSYDGDITLGAMVRAMVAEVGQLRQRQRQQPC